VPADALKGKRLVGKKAKRNGKKEEVRAPFSPSWVVELFLSVATQILLTNWLQVSASTKLSEIDEREGKEFEPQMTTLFGLKAQQ